MSGRSSVMRLAVGVAGLLLVGACTGSPAPGPSQTATGSSGSTSTSTATRSTPTATSTMGVTATEEAAAIAAAQAYLAEFNRAIVSRSTTTLRTKFAPGCVACEGDAAKIDALKASGRTMLGGSLTYTDARVEVWYDPTRLLLQGQMTTEAGTVKDAAGKVVDHFDGGAGAKRILMAKLAGVWLVEGLTS